MSALPCIGREELFQPSGELVAFGRRQPAQSKPVLEAWGVAKTLCGTCSRVEACLRAELAAMRAGARTMGVHGGTDPRERAAMLDPLEEPAPLAADCGTVELRRVMKPDTSSAWLNLGDKANNSGGAGGDWAKDNREAAIAGGGPGRFRDPAFPEASYVDAPGLVLHELMRRGWRLRMPIVWDKGRQQPESLRHVRRPRWSHEMIFLLVPWERSRKSTDRRPKWYPTGLVETGSVWHFPPGSNPASDPHLAPFPDELARRCILPTTLPGDVVFDPFAGSGTVPRVAAELGRAGIGTDLYAGRPDLVHGIGAPAGAPLDDDEEPA